MGKSIGSRNRKRTVINFIVYNVYVQTFVDFVVFIIKPRRRVVRTNVKVKMKRNEKSFPSPSRKMYKMISGDYRITHFGFVCFSESISIMTSVYSIHTT